MSKALFGYLGEPRAYVLLKQIADLKARVAELEKSLESAESEVIALRAIAETREEVKALAERIAGLTGPPTFPVGGSSVSPR
jgi:hypothetical protein